MTSRTAWREGFRSRLLAAMGRAGMTAAETASSAELVESTVGAWTRGESVPTADRVMPLCRALGVDPEWLLEGGAGRLGVAAVETKPTQAKRLYVSGPVTGIEGRNRAAFEAAARELSSRLRCAVELPHDTVPPDAGWIEAMRLSLRAMLGCDGVAMLPGWQRSAGARLEQSVAVSVGMECHTVSGWLRRRRR